MAWTCLVIKPPAFTIRAFEESDYPALARLWNTVYPTERYSWREIKHEDAALPPPCRWERLTAIAGDQLVGCAEYRQRPGMYHPQKFVLYLYVHPDSRRRGIGSALYKALGERLEPFDPISLRVQVSEDRPDAIHFARTRGYAETKRDWQAVLELTSFDPRSFSELERKLTAAGIGFTTLAEMGNTLEAQRAYYDLFGEVRQDVPRSEPASPLEYSQFHRLVFEDPGFTPKGVFLAREDGRLVGLTQLWRSEASADLYTGLTGVSRSHRGRGIATALKVRALGAARANGASRIFTDNDTRNVEMIAVNDKLGFKRLPALLSMANSLKS